MAIFISEVKFPTENLCRLRSDISVDFNNTTNTKFLPLTRAFIFLPPFLIMSFRNTILGFFTSKHASGKIYFFFLREKEKKTHFSREIIPCFSANTRWNDSH